MTEINRDVTALLLVGLGVLAWDACRPTQARPLSDRTLALISGWSGPQKGSGSFGCDDATQNANNKNPKNPVYITVSNCKNTANKSIPNPSSWTCISCQASSQTSISSNVNGVSLGQPNPPQTVDCTKSVNFPTQPSTLVNVGTCIQTSSGMGYCDPPPRTTNIGACQGTFAVYFQQAPPQ